MSIKLSDDGKKLYGICCVHLGESERDALIGAVDCYEKELMGAIDNISGDDEDSRIGWGKGRLENLRAASRKIGFRETKRAFIDV